MGSYYKIFFSVLVSSVLFFPGCAKKTLVPFDQVLIPSEVEMKLIEGNSITAVVINKKNGNLTVKVSNDSGTTNIEKSKIQEIYVFKSAYDENGQLITKKEISGEKNSKYAVIYTLGGGILGFGTGLFLSSLAYRSGDENFKVLNPISLGGGVLGAAYFHLVGKKRDRILAIERIREQREFAAAKFLEGKKTEREKLLQQLEEMKKEKARIDAEKKKLEEKLKKKKKKKK